MLNLCLCELLSSKRGEDGRSWVYLNEDDRFGSCLQANPVVQAPSSIGCLGVWERITLIATALVLPLAPGGLPPFQLAHAQPNSEQTSLLCALPSHHIQDLLAGPTSQHSYSEQGGPSFRPWHDVMKLASQPRRWQRVPPCRPLFSPLLTKDREGEPTRCPGTVLVHFMPVCLRLCLVAKIFEYCYCSTFRCYLINNV